MSIDVFGRSDRLNIALLLSSLIGFILLLDPNICLAQNASENPRKMKFAIIDSSVCSDCVVIYAQGSIVADSISDFQNALDELEKKGLWSRQLAREGKSKSLFLMLNSSGGDVQAAYSIGRQIRLYRGNTVVAMPSTSPGRPRDLSWSSCNSACGFILLGGIERSAVRHSALGLHQPRYNVNLKKNYTGNQVLQIIDRMGQTYAEMAMYFEEMNASPKLLLYIYRTPHSAMHRMEHKIAQDFGLLNKQI